MIVKDLIEKLETYNQETEVFIPDGDQLTVKVRYVQECTDDDNEEKKMIVIHGY